MWNTLVNEIRAFWQGSGTFSFRCNMLTDWQVYRGGHGRHISKWLWEVMIVAGMLRLKLRRRVVNNILYDVIKSFQNALTHLLHYRLPPCGNLLSLPKLLNSSWSWVYLSLSFISWLISWGCCTSAAVTRILDTSLRLILNGLNRFLYLRWLILLSWLIYLGDL